MASLLPYTGTLGSRLAKHLLRRATYNTSKSRIDEFKNYTVPQAISVLGVPSAKNLEQPIHYVDGDLTSPSPWIENDPTYGDVNLNNGSTTFLLRKYVQSWWLDEARRDTSYRAKMTYFLFTDFTADLNTLDGKLGFYYDYLKLLEFFSLGDWKEFIFQISKNNIMLHYLNNSQNTKNNPNENYAREILELFTIGKGEQVGAGDYTNYTETDVVEAARVLTGWRSLIDDRNSESNGVENGDIPCGFPEPTMHDFGQKVFSHRFGGFVIESWNTGGKTLAQKKERMEEELKIFIQMVLDQEETAKFICRKLYRYLVSGKITAEIENDIIVPLASTFRSNYNLQEVLDQLLLSQHFYDLDDSDNSDELIGGLIKSPLDLVLQTLNIVEYPVPDPITHGLDHYKHFYQWQMVLAVMDPAGQHPFWPPSVVGFPANYESPDFDKFWFNTSSIIFRYKLGDILLTSWRTKAEFSVTNFVENNVSSPGNASQLVSDLLHIFFPEDIDVDRLSYFVSDILLDNSTLTESMWEDEWVTYANTGDASVVEDVLRSLFRSILWSQEYQSN
jgi:uncharacterized protein (DUF1800 family)